MLLRHIAKSAALLAALLIGCPAPSLGAPSQNQCNDQRLKEAMKPELSPENAQRECARSLEAEATYGFIRIKNRAGKELEPMHCCAAIRILANEQTERFLEEKRKVCGQAKATIPQDCSALSCVESVERIYEQQEADNEKLADLAKEIQRVGNECRPVLEKVQSSVLRQQGEIRAEISRRPGSEATIRSAATMRVR